MSLLREVCLYGGMGVFTEGKCVFTEGDVSLLRCVFTEGGVSLLKEVCLY